MQFEDNKINGHVPAQIVLNPDGSTSGATVPDARTADEKVHATIGTVRAMSRTMLFARDVHFGDRASLIRVSKGMATPNDGDMIPATTHPEVVKGILRGDQASCSDTEWLNDPYKRGMWSRGTAYLDEQGRPQGWVRMPDLNQAKEGSLPPPFARGGADAKAGSIGKDTMRELSGNVSGISETFGAEGTADGVFSKPSSLPPKNYTPTAADVGNAGTINFLASRGLPEGHTGTEFAPWHIYGVSYSITSNGVMNEGAIDAEQVMGEVLLNRTRITKLEDDGGLLQITGHATLTGMDNKIVMAGIVPGIKLEKGDVIQIAGAGEANAKLRTVEGIVNNGELILNFEHCGSRGNGSLKLQDFSGDVTVTRIAKWHSAASGLGQDWVALGGALRVKNATYLNTRNREIFVSVIGPGYGVSAVGMALVCNGIAISSADAAIEAKQFTVSGPITKDATYTLAASNAEISLWLERC